MHKKSVPKISIVMPVFNAGKYLDCSIDSIIKQTFASFELIIIDDGSTDNSIEVLNKWREKDERIKVCHSAVNHGVSITRNYGIEHATTPIIAFIDADDTWHPEKLAIQYGHHEKNQCAFSCTAFWFGSKKIRSNKRVNYRSLLCNNIINTSSVMIDTRQLSAKFSSNEKSEDYTLWLDVAKKNKIHFINEVLVKRTVFNGASSNKLLMAKRRWSIYRKNEGLSLIESLYYFIFYAVSSLKKYYF